MTDWNRRSVMATGAALATGSLLASAGTATAEDAAGAEAEGWSSTQGGPKRGRCVEVDTSGGLADGPADVSWRYDENGASAVVGGTVYLRTETELHALDATDGTPLWKQTGIGRSPTAPTVTDDTVFVGGSELLALEADTGHLRWRESFDTDEPVPAPLVSFETAYVLLEGELYAFDATDGSLRWERGAVDVERRYHESEEPEMFTHSFYQEQDGVVAVGESIWTSLDAYNPGAMAALDPLTGEVEWAEHVETETAGLSATDDRILVEDGAAETIAVFDIDSRELEDRIDGGDQVSALDETAVVQGQNGLECFDLGGEATESWRIDGAYAVGEPVIVNNTVVAAHSPSAAKSDDRIVGYDLADGTERWDFLFEQPDWSNGASVQFVCVDGGTVYTEREGQTIALPLVSDGGGDDQDDESGDDGTDESDDESAGDEGDGSSESDGSSGSDDEGTAGQDDHSSDGGAAEPDSGSGSGNGTDGDETGGNGTDGGDETGGGNGTDGDDAAAGDAGREDTASDADDETDEGDAIPGFTTGTGVLGGVLGLEWLRRRADGEATESRTDEA